MNFTRLESYGSYADQSKITLSEGRVFEHDKNNSKFLDDLLESEFNDLPSLQDQPPKKNSKIGLSAFQNAQERDDFENCVSMDGKKENTKSSIITSNHKDNIKELYDQLQSVSQPDIVSNCSTLDFAHLRVRNPKFEIDIKPKSVTKSESGKKKPVTEAPVVFREFTTVRRVENPNPLNLRELSSMNKAPHVIIDLCSTPETPKQDLQLNSGLKQTHSIKFKEEKRSSDSQAQMGTALRSVCVLYTNLSKEDVEKLRVLSGKCTGYNN